MHDELVLYFYTYERSVHLQVKWCLNEYVTCHFLQSFLFVCIAEAKKKKKRRVSCKFIQNIPETTQIVQTDFTCTYGNTTVWRNA